MLITFILPNSLEARFFSVHWVPEASLWNYTVKLKRNIATVLPLQGCCFHHGSEKQICVGSFSVYIIYKLLKKCQVAVTSELAAFWVFFPLTCLSDRPGSPFFYCGEKQQMRQRDKGLAQPLTRNRSGWRNTTQHVPCCSPRVSDIFAVTPPPLPGLGFDPIGSCLSALTSFTS